jgi:hypothetical protein
MKKQHDQKKEKTKKRKKRKSPQKIVPHLKLMVFISLFLKEIVVLVWRCLK